MAQHRTPEQIEEVRAFVRTLYERSGFPTQEDFARSAGIHPVSVSHWMSRTPGRQRMPDAYNLMRLMVAAGMLGTGPRRLPAIESKEDVITQLLEDPRKLTPEAEPYVREFLEAERAIGYRALRLADALERLIERPNDNTASGSQP